MATSAEVRAFPNGKPVSIESFLEEGGGVEYARIPWYKPGEVVVIQSISAGDLIVWSEANEGEAKRTAGLRLIVKSVVDGDPNEDEGATGRRILDDSHIAVLRKKPHKVTEQIVKGILKLNGMEVKQDAATKKD